MSLTFTVAILSIMKNGLQSLNLNFDRVFVSERVLSWPLGGRTLFVDPYGQIIIPQIEEDVYKSCDYGCFEILGTHNW